MNKRYDELLVPLCGKGILRRLENTNNISVWLLVCGILCSFLIINCSCKDDEIIFPLPSENSIPRDESPSWSPDGQLIAYTHFSINPNDSIYPTGLYIVDTNGQNRRLVIAGPANNSVWSSDGKRIAFNNGDIFTISPNGDSLYQVTNIGGAFFPSWSPDDLFIAFDVTSQGNMNGIWITSKDGYTTKYLGLGRYPAWSPDGKRFAYSGAPGSTQSENQIWVADTNGSNKIKLTSNTAITNRYPCWSPSGNKICWISDNKLWFMNANGENQKKIIDGSHARWAPNSNQVVFSRLVQSNSKIVLWKIRIDGTNEIQLTN